MSIKPKYIPFQSALLRDELNFCVNRIVVDTNFRLSNVQ